MKIRDARVDDAQFIGRGIVEAIGRNHCEEMAGGRVSVEEIEQLFANLAARDDTQYSWLNTLVAETDDGSPAGIIVGYDGGRLHELRRPFLEEAQRLMGMDTTHVDDETDGSEFYLDTLFVDPEFRHLGVGERLLQAGRQRAAASGKPAGLLVDPENTRARRLYERSGFRSLGFRPFFGITMEHMQG